MKKGLSEETIIRIESLEGCNICNAVKMLYFDQFLTIRKLEKRWKCNSRTVMKVIRHCGYEPRHGSEAIKTQWIDNAERRQHASDILSNINHNLALQGLHVRQGKTKENSVLIRNMAEKLKVTTSLNRPEVRALAQLNSKKARLLHPENNVVNRLKPSKYEQIMFDFLNSIGLNFEFRYYILHYWVDFYIPSLKLAIDCAGSNRFPFSLKRHEAIASQNIQVIYCINRYIEKSDFGDLQNYIAGFDIGSFDPTMSRHKTVIWGASNHFPFGKDIDGITTEVVSMKTYHKIIVT